MTALRLVSSQPSAVSHTRGVTVGAGAEATEPAPAPGDITPDNWIEYAACRGCSPDLFFPERGEYSAPAKAVCRTCPVSVECLEAAMDANERHGIWGGASERERRAMRRKRGRAMAAKTSNRTRVTQALARRGSATANQIADDLRITRQNANGHLSALYREGQATRHRQLPPSASGGAFYVYQLCGGP